MSGLSSRVICYTGPRGSGKSLAMTKSAMKYMAHRIPCWSNCGIHFEVSSLGNGRPGGYFESLPFDINAFRAFEQEYTDGVVCIDEVPLWADSRRSMSVANILLNKVFTLIRKRNLVVLLTAQSEDWLDNRIKFQIDALVHCYDLSYLNHNFKKGTMIAMTIMDKSGIYRGRPGFTWQRTLKGAQKYWDCFNSWQEQDPVQAMADIRIERRLPREDEGIIS